MSELPVIVKLLGKEATNPALPSKNLLGTLWVENGNLVFSDGKFAYKIPLEHIDNLYSYQNYDGLRDTCRIVILIIMSLATWFLAAPFLWYYFWYIDTPFDTRIQVAAWDEYHGLKSTTTFELGSRKSDVQRGLRVIQEIWWNRGEARRLQNEDNRVIIREF